MIFESFEIESGKLSEVIHQGESTRLHAWNSTRSLRYDNDNTSFFGFVYKGATRIESKSNAYTLKSGQYFALNEEFQVSGGAGLLIEVQSYRTLNSLGGPIEDWGRLKYIDGCTDTLLIPPVKLGDPCLNALYFPPNINQTQHTHPSFRIGIVVSGRGECILPDQKIDLLPGMIFIIHQDGLHSFRTPSDESMIVVAYHPDSDFGPQDENHPMINRTIVEGTSAAEIRHIRTK